MMDMIAKLLFLYYAFLGGVLSGNIFSSSIHHILSVLYVIIFLAFYVNIQDVSDYLIAIFTFFSRRWSFAEAISFSTVGIADHLTFLLLHLV